jgi:hypothetical protein
VLHYQVHLRQIFLLRGLVDSVFTEVVDDLSSPLGEESLFEVVTDRLVVCFSEFRQEGTANAVSIWSTNIRIRAKRFLRFFFML